MREEYHVTQLQLRDPRERERLTAFLLENHLTYEDNIQTAFAVLDENDTLSAGAAGAERAGAAGFCVGSGTLCRRIL